jgi:hypothetical protein
VRPSLWPGSSRTGSWQTHGQFKRRWAKQRKHEQNETNGVLFPALSFDKNDKNDDMPGFL